MIISALQHYIVIVIIIVDQDYRNEVGEILVADKQLAEEIEFDLKKLEEEQKKAAAAKAATAAVSTPQAATPHAQMVSRYTYTFILTHIRTHVHMQNDRVT